MATTKRGLTTLTILLLAACGGSGSDGDGNPGPSSASAFTIGAVQSTQGGLVVNGVTFRTEGARITTDDTAAPVTLSGEDRFRDHVHEGMIVRVRGTIDEGGASGHATEIELHDLLEGAIDDRGPGHVRVSGVDVSLDDSTVLEDNHGGRLTPDDFSVGVRVELSGHADGRGGIRATSVRRSDGAPEAEREVRAWVVAVSGTVLDLAFANGGPVALRVDVSGVVPAPGLAVGDLVEVKTRGLASGGGVFTATAVRLEDDLSGGVNDEAEIEGIVTAADANGFTIAGVQVVYAPNPMFSGGTKDDVVVGAKVEAEGSLRADGVLVAREVKLRPVIRVDATVESVDAAGGTLSLLGLTVHVTPSTELREVSSLAALAGTRVEVRGAPTRDGSGIDAIRLELISAQPEDRAFLRGVVTEETPITRLGMLGLSIDTSAASFRNLSDVEITADAFFEAVIPGRTVVKVRWRPYPASTGAPVEEAELEN